MLVAREVERRRLAEAVEKARHGRGVAVLLRGEPGIGKTALLEDMERHAEGMRVLRARGVEAESSLAYAGLFELLAPITGLMERLPGPRREALERALGVREGLPGDRFGVFAATLMLLAEAGEQAPVLMLVDDGHWLDEESARALAFCARRLAYDPACLVVAVRDERGGPFDAAGFSVVDVGALASTEVADLLTASSGGHVDPGVAAELHSATGGNPLALLELARRLDADQLAGSLPLPQLLPSGPGVEKAFGPLLAALPDGTREALVIAAGDDSGDLPLLARALGERGLSVAAFAPAEERGIVSIAHGRLAFCHPVVRSVAYHRASPPARRAAHAALAAALVDGASDRPRRAWHLAAASVVPDEAIARDLEAVGVAALERSAPAAAGRTLEAAARVTPEAPARVRRLLAAGQAHHLAGEPEHALRLLDQALELAGDPLARADVQRTRAHVQTMRSSMVEARALLTGEAELVEPHDPRRAAAMWLDASWSSCLIGDIRESLRLAERAWPVAAQAGDALNVAAQLALGQALILSGDPVRARPLLEQARPLVHSRDLWIHGYLAMCLGFCEVWLENFHEGADLLAELVARIRADGALSALPFTLVAQAYARFHAGDWRAAYALAKESLATAEEVGQASLVAQPLTLIAQVAGGRGRLSEAEEHLKLAQAIGNELGVGSAVVVMARWVRGEIHLGRREHEQAIAALEPAGRFALDQGLEEPGAARWAQDLAEAYARTGRRREAEATLDLLEGQAERTGRHLAHAGAARCRGLLADDDDFDAHFERARQHHAAVQCPFELARTELCYGERLRRARRRTDARAPLRRAAEAFDALGAEPWAERARTELRATGERARRRTPDAADDLTPQELRVALLVAEGVTNREAADALFLSPRTIETHLNSAYRKLGVRSRVELVRRLRSPGAASRVPAPAPA